MPTKNMCHVQGYTHLSSSIVCTYYVSCESNINYRPSFNGLVQNCGITIAKALKILQSSIKQSICSSVLSHGKHSSPMYILGGQVIEKTLVFNPPFHQYPF